MTNPGNDGYVIFQLCTGQPPAVEQPRLGVPGHQHREHGLGLRQRYSISDSSYNLCLSLPTTDLYQGQYSKIMMQRCDGSSAQKWNAAANFQDSSVANVPEK